MFLGTLTNSVKVLHLFFKNAVKYNVNFFIFAFLNFVYSSAYLFKSNHLACHISTQLSVNVFLSVYRFWLYLINKWQQRKLWVWSKTVWVNRLSKCLLMSVGEWSPFPLSHHSAKMMILHHQQMNAPWTK